MTTSCGRAIACLPDPEPMSLVSSSINEDASIFFLSTNLVAGFIHCAPSVGDVQTTVHGADAVAQSSPPNPLLHSGEGERRGGKGGRMNAQLRRRLEMAARARDFLRAHQMDGVGQDLGLT